MATWRACWHQILKDEPTLTGALHIAATDTGADDATLPDCESRRPLSLHLLNQYSRVRDKSNGDAGSGEVTVANDY